MIIERQIGEKGRVAIPKDTGKFLGLRKGKRVIKPKQDPEEFLKDFLNVPRLKKPLKIKDLKKALEEQYDLP